ncbi:hypothetical protein F4803DRAFT_170878 [Xylaria telfairii]|nr:hypothetical protein F4803DRAFT_170878 [Xylaria telfairii]
MMGGGGRNPLPSAPRKDTQLNNYTNPQGGKEMEDQQNTNNQSPPLTGNTAPGSPAKDHGRPPIRHECEQEAATALHRFQQDQRGPKDQKPEGNASINNSNPPPTNSNKNSKNSESSTSAAGHPGSKRRKRVADDSHDAATSTNAMRPRTAADEPNRGDAGAEEPRFALHPSQTQRMQLLPSHIPQGDSTATARGPAAPGFVLHPSQTQGMQLLPSRILQGGSTATAQAGPSRFVDISSGPMILQIALTSVHRANRRTRLPTAPTSTTASRCKKKSES